MNNSTEKGLGKQNLKVSIGNIIPVVIKLSLIILIGYLLASCSESSPKKMYESKLEMEVEKLEKSLGDSVDYFQTVKSILNNSESGDTSYLEAKRLYLEGLYHNANNSFKEAVFLLTKAAGKSPDSANTLSGSIYHEIGNAYRELGKREAALKAFKTSSQLLSFTKSTGKRARVLNTTGFLYWEVTKFDSALYYFKKSLELKKSLDDTDSYATTLNNIGSVYYHWGNYDQALDYFTNSFKLQLEVNDNDGAALILTNVGLVYKETDQYEKALEIFRESLTYAEKEVYPTTFGYIYSNMGSAFLEIDLDSARYYYGKSLVEYNKADHLGGKALALKGLGEVYLKLGNIDAARKQFDQMLSLASKGEITLRIAEAYKFLGIISKDLGDYQSAEKHFLRSIEIAEELKKVELLADDYEILTQVYEAQNEIETAYNSLKMFEHYKELISNEDLKKRIANLKYNFESEKLQRTIEAQKYANDKQKLFIHGLILLSIILIIVIFLFFKGYQISKKQNKSLEKQKKLILEQKEELEKLNNELRESNLSKDKFFSIIAHDLRNPFQSLISLSDLLVNDVNENYYDDLPTIAESIRNSVASNYKLLENLLEWAEFQRGKKESNPEEFYVWEIIKNTVDELSSLSQIKNIKIVQKVDDTLMIEADKRMIEFALRNLLTNAIKFTKKNEKVEIYAEEVEDMVMFSVVDNGIGIEKEKIRDIFNPAKNFSSFGTHREKGSGLGLSLCQEFIELHGGKIDVESEPGLGSKFTFLIPKHQKN